MGLLSISVLLFAGLVLSGAFTAPRLERKLFSEERVANISAIRRCCPPGWHYYRSRCFHFFSQPLAWWDAQTHCLHLGGSLASIHSLKEYHFVQTLTRGSGYPRAWVGGTDAVKEGKWFWIDGTPLDFAKWAPGEPNNWRGEHCLEINHGDKKLWNDLSCSNSIPFICAKRAP